MIKTSIAKTVIGLAYLVSSYAHAGGLLDDLGSLFKVGVTSNNSNEVAVVDMLKADFPRPVYKSNVEGSYQCSPSGISRAEEAVLYANRSKDNLKRAAAGKYGAMQSAYCARTMKENGESFPGLTFPMLINSVGDFLSYYALNTYDGDPERDDAAVRAKAYLEFASSNGEPTSPMLDKLNKQFFKESSPAKTVSKPKISGSAESIIEQFSSNRYGFSKKHQGEVFKITGKISVISYNGKEIELLGNSKKSNNDLSWIDMVYCELADQKEKDKAADLLEGKKITVIGVFDFEAKNGQGNVGLFTLTACRIQ